jgi:hypothetical protein
VNATAHFRNGINIVAEDENGDVTQVNNAGEAVGRILFGDTRPGKYAGIDCIADGAPGTNDYPGRLVFRTTADGSGSTAERMRITSAGEVLISNSGNRFLSLDRTNVSTGSGEFNLNVESTSQTTISYDDGAPLVIGTSSSPRTQSGFTERLRITSDGIIKTPNLNGNNHREIHRHITGFNSGSSVVNYLLICQTDRTNVRLAGRLFTARASGTSACAAQLFDITFQQNHNATHRSGSIMGLHSGSNTYGHAEAEFVSLTYNSTDYYAIRFSSGWITDFDTCSFDGIREHLGTELFTHIDSTNDTITNVSVLDAATNKGDVTIQQADLRISDGDIIMPSGHGISFSSNANASGTTSEVLDDYEEGEFTITLAGSVTIHTQTQARYVKIGQMVMVTGQFRINNDNSNAALRVTNLPFVSLNTGSNDGGFSPGAIRLYNYPDPGGYGNFISMVQKNSNDLYFYYSRTNAADSQITASSNGYVAFSCMYHTAS